MERGGEGGEGGWGGGGLVVVRTKILTVASPASPALSDSLISFSREAREEVSVMSSRKKAFLEKLN